MTHQQMIDIATEISDDISNQFDHINRSEYKIDTRKIKDPGLFFGALRALIRAKEKGLLSKRQPGELG